MGGVYYPGRGKAGYACLEELQVVVMTYKLVLTKLLWRGGLGVESVVDSVKGVVLKLYLPSVLFWFSSLLLDGFLMILNFGSSFFFVL